MLVYQRVFHLSPERLPILESSCKVVFILLVLEDFRITGNGESGWVRSLPDLDKIFIWSPLIILHSYGIDGPFIQVIYFTY
jgi:hypothetical protein